MPSQVDGKRIDTTRPLLLELVSSCVRVMNNSHRLHCNFDAPASAHTLTGASLRKGPAMSWDTDQAKALAATIRRIEKLDDDDARSVKANGRNALSNSRIKGLNLRQKAFDRAVRQFTELREGVTLEFVRQESERRDLPPKAIPAQNVTPRQWSRAADEVGRNARVYARLRVRYLMEQAGINPTGLIIDVELAAQQRQRNRDGGGEALSTPEVQREPSD